MVAPATAAPTSASSSPVTRAAPTRDPLTGPIMNREHSIVPTSSMAASPVALATVAPAPAGTQVVGATPLAAQPAVEAVIKQVARAETALRTGQLEATMDYGQGPRSAVQIQFDLGDGQKPLRFHSVATYMSTAGDQVVERITIGEQSWERKATSTWVAQAAEESPLAQLQTFLPQADMISDATIAKDAHGLILRWYDARRAADMTLLVDPASATPHELRQEAHLTGVVLQVTYSGWNTPVVITPPSAS
jgi:hypothetical protein